MHPAEVLKLQKVICSLVGKKKLQDLIFLLFIYLFYFSVVIEKDNKMLEDDLVQVGPFT